MQRKDLIPSIEGLRAIAVLAVLLFHLDVPGLQGGFLGVDVFFVISGYIITRNILKQRERGDFRLGSFYYARFRRLIPALAVVTLLTLVAAVPLLPPADLAATGESAAFTVLSASNVLFWWQADYFDAASHTKPLLHTWSLGVEEQFYLVWPVTLLLLARGRALAIGCGVFALASLGGAWLLVADHPSAVFFLSPFRVYQFMAGALIAATGWSTIGRRGDLLQLLGLAGFAVAVATMSGEDSPLLAGGSAAAASLLLVLSRESTLATRLTGNPLLLWIGQRSYAIYLVHWPLVVLWKFHAGPELALPAQVGLGVAAIVAAMALHSFVERPFRKKSGADDTFAGRAAAPVTVLLLLFAMFGAANLWGNQGYPQRQPDDVRRALASAADGFEVRKERVRTGICHAASGYSTRSYDRALCAPLQPGRTNVLVIGDSVAADIYMLLTEAFPDVVFSQATGGSCPPYTDVNKYSGCNEINALRFGELAGRDYDYVVFAGQWREPDLGRLVRSVGQVRGLGRKVVVFGPGLRFAEDVTRSLSMSASLAEARGRIRAGEQRNPALAAKLRAALDGVTHVDLVGLQCAPQCKLFSSGQLLYIDEFHMSPTGARLFGQRLAARSPELFGAPRAAAGAAAR